jgi:mannitol/fructose-specific phosphotransferase system IIA component (Ntr-type)
MTLQVLEKADGHLRHAEELIKQTIKYLSKNGHIKESNELREAWCHLNRIDWLD